jgi:nucleoid-associated protein YgaU
MDGEKPLIRRTVPSDYGKNQIWDMIMQVDASVGDLIVDINPQPGVVHAVQSVDTLSDIAERFYSDASAYQQIVESNSDLLNDSIQIHFGLELKLPSEL